MKNVTLFPSSSTKIVALPQPIDCLTVFLLFPTINQGHTVSEYLRHQAKKDIMKTSNHVQTPRHYLPFVLGALGITVFYTISRYNYLLFHSLAETISITIGYTVFFIAWNTRQIVSNHFLLFLGIAYLFIGGLDILHTLSYKGMAVFAGDNANQPTQLWIASRYTESISLLIAPAFIRQKINISFVFSSFTGLFLLFLASIFYWHSFPDCFIADTGLTSFKIISEYIICLILVGAACHFFSKRALFDPEVLVLMVASLVFTIFSEFAFTFYISVYGLSNMIGHIGKIISVYFIYSAVVKTGLKKPYSLLFQELKIKELEKEKTIAELEKALSEVKTLQGIIPICSKCKKIRDDEGFWQQVDHYIAKHSNAEFSHAMCSQCADDLYGGQEWYEKERYKIMDKNV